MGCLVDGPLRLVSNLGSCTTIMPYYSQNYTLNSYSSDLEWGFEVSYIKCRIIVFHRYLACAYHYSTLSIAGGNIPRHGRRAMDAVPLAFVR